MYTWLTHQTWRGLLLLVLLLAFAAPANGQNTFEVLASASTFQIEGRSTAGAYTCASDDVGGVAHLAPTTVRNVREEVHRSQADVSVLVPARSFDCGKSRMNADFYEALQADEHPVIRYDLVRADVRRGPAPDGGIELDVEGRLAIAGTTRTVQATVTGYRFAEGIYRVQGSLPLRMSDFGIEPPTALFGLVKARDEIEVHFDLVGVCELLLAEARQEGLDDWRDFAHVEERPTCSG